MPRKKSYVWDLSKEEIQERVNTCYCMKDVLLEFGYSGRSGTMTKTFYQIFEKFDIDISHFNPFKRNISNTKYNLKEILVKDSNYSNSDRLKKRLLKEGLMEYKCEMCGNTGFWNEKPLTLQLDHKDGNHCNNEIDNLRFLCPNCHSQTKTYGSKNAKRIYDIDNCKEYNPNKIMKISKRPDLETLKKLVNKYSVSEISEIYKVKMGTVYKWMRLYNIKLKKRR